uniref:Wsv222-like protein, paralog 1 n=1 Tax=Hemigrapsus takanoi nimavirus TaxID=2133792 RepID=A0A401IP04_9VIRU|nr:MAG: wsv222-like protein [Hemigrapsus takanoi nimavirus]GBG35331.1 wsv222-like protein, paralog 1 [Hemigrapsus takanoi nimavirus]
MQFYRFRSTFTNIIRRLTGTEMDPLQELVSFARQSGTSGTSHTAHDLSSNGKQTLFRILLLNPSLLFNEYEGYDTVWRWLIKYDYFLIIRFVLNKASGGEYGIRWHIPSNRYDKNNGSTIFTDHSLPLTARLFNLLFTMSGEKLHLYNKTTYETVLHILVKQNTIQGKETAFNILNNIVADNSMDLDPDLIDFAGRTALHYALERGELRVAELLVERIGADWDLGLNRSLFVSNETLDSRHPECVEFLQKCREKYSIKPNSEGGGETCVICQDEIEASTYSMRCCKVKLHTVCLRKHLARAEAISCLLCRQEICKDKDKDLYDSIPNTVFKSKWEKERAHREAAAASASTPSTETEPGANVATLDTATDDDTAASLQTEEELGIRVRFFNITPYQDVRLSPFQWGVPDTNLRILPSPSVIMGVSSLMREHNFSSDLTTASTSNYPSSVEEEEDNHLYEEILIMDHHHQITQIFDQEESLPPPPLPQQPLSAEGDGWSDDEGSDIQPVLETFSSTTSSAESSMPSPASLFETPTIFNGYYSFFGQKIVHRSLRVMIPPDCVEAFASQSIMFEDILDSFSTDRRRLFNLLTPMTLTSYQSLPRNKVQDFLSTLRIMCRDLDPLYRNRLFVNKCTEKICDIYGTSLTSNFGLLLKEYVKTRVEDEGERNVLAVQLQHMRYHETISDGDDAEDLLVQYENMAQWLYVRGLHTQTREKIKKLHSRLLIMLSSATNLHDFERLLAAIGHVLTCM